MSFKANPLVKRMSMLGRIGSVLAGGLAILALWSWAAGVSDLWVATPEHKSMAPSTVLLLVLTSLAVFLRYQGPASTVIMRLDCVLAGLVAFAGLLAAFRPCLGWVSTLEQGLAQTTDQISGIPAGTMGPLTGPTFVAAALALLLQLPPQGRRPSARWISTAFALAIGLVGAGMASSYAFGNQGLNALIPMAFWTAISFVLLGLALLGTPPLPKAPSAPGDLHLTHPAFDPDKKRPNRAPLAVSGLLALAIGILGAFFLRHEQGHVRAKARETLQAIGDSKAAQILNWRQERMGDAQFLSKAAFVARDVRTFLADPASGPARAELLNWLTLLKAGDRYSFVGFYDTNHELRLSVPERPKAVSSPHHDLRVAVLQTNHVVMTDLHRGEDNLDIHLGIAFPVLAPDPLNPQSATGSRPQPMGVILLRLDPRRFLYPLIQSWPTPSRSAEIELIRREGNEVVYLNELRHRTNTALVLRAPIEPGAPSPTTLAALGQTGLVEGLDYRGVPVLAAVRSVPDSPWSIVAKVDQDEIYAPLHQAAWLTLLLTAVLALATGLMVRLFWQRRELASERQGRALADRVEHLMRSANDIILLTDEHWQILEANDRALETYGYSLAELQRMRQPDLRTPETREEFAHQMGELTAGSRAFFQTVHQRKEGSTFPVEVSARIVVIGGVRYQLAIVRDITQRKAQEREIERLRRLYATLSQINQCLVRVRSRAELFHEVCRITVEHAGFKAVWIGWLDRDTHAVKPVGRAGDSEDYVDQIKVYADERPEGCGPVGTCIRKGKPSISNDFLGDPRTLPWREAATAHGLRAVAALPVRFNGEVCGAFTVYAGERDVFRDKEVALLEEAAAAITFALENLEREALRQQAEAALRESEERFRALVENGPEGIIVQIEGKFAYVNGQAVRLFGANSPGDLIGKPVMDRFHPDFRPVIKERIRLLNEERKAVSRMEEVYLRLDGAGYEVEVSAVPFTYAGKNGALVFFRDIADRKRLEAQLRQAQKMEAIGQLAGGVAHDFNNILTATMMQLGLLQHKPNLPADMRESLDELMSHAQRAAGLTRQLLLFSRRSIMQAQTLDLNEVVENLFKMLRRLIGEHIILDWHGTSQLPQVMADAGMLEQVVMNLVVNARDAMPKGGRLTLSTDTVEINPAQANAIPDARPGRFVCLAVADTGCGMDQTILKRIFDPFFTTKEIGKGTGLGLATVYGIVSQHQGWITVESQVAKGSTFRVFLPVLAQATLEPLPGSPVEPAPGGHETILLVEDDASVRQTTSLLLQHLGYRILEAGNGVEALNLWQELPDPVDLLFTDMVMPEGLSGLELAEKLQVAKPGLRVIISSGYSADLVEHGAGIAKGITYVPKPCPPAQLVAVVRHCLDQPHP